MNQGNFTLIQLSDLHLNPDEAMHREVFDAVLARVEQLAPDVIIGSGDLSADGHLHKGLFEKVKAQLDRLPQQPYVMPGNHDVGNKVTIPEDPFKPEYLEEWLRVFGMDRFRVELGRWIILGLNSQIIGSGLPTEADQLDLVDQALADANRDDKLVAVFVHTPPFLMHPDEQLRGRAHYWAYDPGPRQIFLKRMNNPRIKLVANGHLHWHRTYERDDKQWVWCPPLSFIVDDANFPRGGNICGFMRYSFTDTGVTHELVRMDDLPAAMVWIDRPKIELPGREPITVAEIVIDLSHAPVTNEPALPGMLERLDELGRTIRITVLLDDDDKRLAEALKDLPLDACVLPYPEARREFVESLGAERVVAIAGGDVEPTLFQAAAFSIAVLSPDATMPYGAEEADILANTINDALDLLRDPSQISEQLRGL